MSYYKILILLIICVITTFCHDQPPKGFIHRGYLRWLTDLSRTDRPEVPWPSIVIDSPLIVDYNETLDFLERSGMNEITVWGLFTNTSWELIIENTINPMPEIKAPPKTKLAGLRLLFCDAIKIAPVNAPPPEHPTSHPSTSAPLPRTSLTTTGISTR